MEKHGVKGQEKTLSMTELLTALTHAQKEREKTLEQFKRMSEAEKKRAENAQAQLECLEAELGHAKKKSEDLNQKQKDLEKLIEDERETHNNLLKKKEEEYNEELKANKEKILLLHKKLVKTEEKNSELLEDLGAAKDKIKSLTEEEEKLNTRLKNMRAELEQTKEELSVTKKNNDIAESELHVTKLQLLKENNINNRLIDELKRMRKDIDGYQEEIERLKKLKDNHKNSLSKQIKELTTLITENGKENSDENLREIRTSLSAILKENFVLNNKINEVYSVLTKGETPVISVATQTSIGLEEMFSYENMDKEATCIIMRLREELITNKSNLLEVKQQNESLKDLLRSIKEQKEQRDLVDEESRVEKLEEAVVYLREMLKEAEKPYTNDTSIVEALEGMRKDLDKLKGHVYHQTSCSKVGNEQSEFQFRPFTRPIKLISHRAVNQS